MGLFDKLLGKTESKKPEIKKYPSDDEIAQRNKAFTAKFEQAKNLFVASLGLYNSAACQCAYPRFQQMIGIDCSTTGNSFKCYDTDLLIDVSKAYFDTAKSALSDECTNEQWTCKKCGSVYEYGWSDFSIYVERQKLKLISLTVTPTGKPASKPIPLFLGLMGHSYPSKTELINVDFGDFEKYMTEK